MKNFKYEFEVDNDFEVGCCFDCPLHEWVDYDDGDGYSETDLRCTIGSSFENCPLEEVKEIKKMIELMDQAITLKEMHDRIY